MKRKFSDSWNNLNDNCGARVAVFKHTHGKDEWLKKVYRVMALYEKYRGRVQSGYSALRNQADKDLVEQSNFRKAEKLLSVFINRVDQTGLGIERYIRWSFEYAFLFFHTTKFPHLSQLYSDKLISAYLAWQIKQSIAITPVTIQSTDLQEAEVKYRRILKPIWGSEWRSVMNSIISL